MTVRVVVTAAALIGLVGCAEFTAGLPQFGGRTNATSQGIRTLALLDSSVRVRGPEGYCVDQSASSARSGFAVLAGCAILSENTALMPSLDGLITVQFGAAGSASVNGNEEVFAAFLESETGRGLLAGDGDVTNVATLATNTDRAGVTAYFHDLSGPAFAGTSGPQWRGFLDVHNRLVTVSVLSLNRRSLSPVEGELLLVVAMASIAEVNTDATPTR